MHEVLRSCKQNPSQNFNNNSSILKNLKIFQKPQNLGFKTWNACKWRKLEAYQVKENLKKLEKKTQGKRFGVREIVFGRWIGADRSREIEEMRIESWRRNI